MSTIGYYIAFDNQKPGSEPPMSGKALALAASELDRLCKEAGMPGVALFLGKRMGDRFHEVMAHNIPQLAATLGQDLEVPDNELRWFRPEDGIIIVDLLMALIRKKPEAIPSAAAVLEDLKNYRIVLGMAQRERAKWHLVAIDPEADNVEAGLESRNGGFDEAIRLYNRALGCADLAGTTDYDRAYMLTERGDCYGELGDHDRAIADYNAALSAQPDYFYALINRGGSWFAKRNYDGAIADYNAAIQLEPEGRVHMILHDRGMALNAKLDYDRALADFDAAIRLDPEYASAYGNRGRTHFFKGDFKKATADLARAQQMDPDAYQPIWLYLARARDGASNARSDLAAQVKALDTGGWPLPVLDLCQGKATPESVIAKAELADADTQHQQRCEASFYVGQWYLLNKDTERARALLREVQFHENAVNEYVGALAELRRL